MTDQTPSDPSDQSPSSQAPPPPPPGQAPPPPPPGYSPPAPPSATPAPPPYAQTPPAAPAYSQAPPAGSPYAQQPQAGAPYGYVPAPVDSLGRPLADWWQRAVAIIIDSVLLAIVFTILRAIFGGNNNGTSGHTSTGHAIVAELISIVISLGYFALLDGGQKGQTIGKMAMGIATRDIATGGSIGPARGLLRRFIYEILFIAFVIPGIINVLSPLWDKRRQAWHDKAASSDVIKVR